MGAGDDNPVDGDNAEFGLHVVVKLWKHWTWYVILDTAPGAAKAFGVMVSDWVPAMTPSVLNVGGGCGIAAAALEQVYLVSEFNVYVTTEKHWYVTLFVNPETVAALGDEVAVDGCNAPVPVAKGSHDTAELLKHCTWYATLDPPVGIENAFGVIVIV